MNKYACLKEQFFKDGGYTLLPLRKEDIFLIMEWRNGQINVLRQKGLLTLDAQQRYYKEIISSTFIEKQPDQILFSFLLDSQCVGYGGLVHIDWEARRGEMSFLADTVRAMQREVYEEDFSHYIRLFKRAVFEGLDFRRICGETYDVREHHIAIMEKNGFILEGRLREHVFINGLYVDSLMHGCLKKDYTHDKTVG